MADEDGLNEEFVALSEQITGVAAPGGAVMALMVTLIGSLRSKGLLSELEIEALIDSAKGDAHLRLSGPDGEAFALSVRESIDLFAVVVRETANSRPN